MAEYVYRVVDKNGVQLNAGTHSAQSHVSRIVALRHVAFLRPELGARVQRAEVVWEDDSPCQTL